MIANKKILVHLALFAVALFYAGNFSFAKWAMPQYISPSAFILLRVGSGMVFFVVYYLFFSKERIKQKQDYWQLFIAAFFGVAFNMTAFFQGVINDFFYQCIGTYAYGTCFCGYFLSYWKQNSY